MCAIDWNLVFQGLIAFGTIMVAILAIWGNYFKYKIVPPKVKIMLINKKGDVTRLGNGAKAIYYHLKVVNSRTWSTARNCRVVLRGLHKKLPNGDFNQLPLPVNPTFIWSPAEVTPPVIDLSHEQTLDFGRIIEGEDKFEPLLNIYANNFQGYVKKDECIRYSLEIIAEGFQTKRLQVFEVAWNGQWSDNLADMENYLTFKEIREKNDEISK